MFAVALADLRAWSREKSRLTFLVIVGTQALIGLVSMLEPGYYYLALALLCIWFACLTGEYGWSRIGTVEWVKRGGLTPGQVAAGRILAALALAVLIHFTALPGTIVLVFLTGMPLRTLACIALASALGAVAAAAWGVAGSPKDLDEDTYFGRLIAGLWLAVTLGFPGLRPGNPLWQTWQAATGSTPRFLSWGLGLLLAAAIAFLFAVASVRWKVRKK